MPRSPRVHFSGALFHVMARGNAGQRIFFDEQDHKTFLEIVAYVKRRLPFRLYAFCLMPNHFHLLMEMDQHPIWATMQRIMVRYSKYSNIRRKRFGHVFQARYKPKLCEKQAYLLTLLRYIHRNPVKARLCARVEDWPWSGHHAYREPGRLDLVDTAFPLSCFGPDLVRARAAYLRFVESDENTGEEHGWETSTSLPCLGSEEFLSRFLELARRRGKAAPEAAKEALEAVASRISGLTGFTIEELRSGSRRRAVSGAKRLFARSASKAGNRASDIAAFLNCSLCAVSKFLNEAAPATPPVAEQVQ